MRIYRAEVEFVNEGEVYGREEFYLEALSDSDADERALAFARESHYDDDRLPDRSIGVSTEEIEETEEEDLEEGAVVRRIAATPKV